MVLRTLTAMSFSTFVPVLLTRRGLSLAQAGTAVSIYLIAVGLGGFIGGPSADRFGTPGHHPFPCLRAISDRRADASRLAVRRRARHRGFLLQSTLPVNVTFAQLIAPISAATVSSLMMGFAWGTGGLSVLLVGMMADRLASSALTVMSALPLVAALLAVSLPSRKQTHVCTRIRCDDCRRDRH